MGGEWFFSISKDTKLSDRDLLLYHDMLEQFRADFDKDHAIGDRIFSDCVVKWGDDLSNKNKYVEITYTGRGHCCSGDRDGNCHSDWCIGGPRWTLFLDPNIVHEKERVTTTHARSAPYSLKVLCIPFERKLEKAFPGVFECYLGDGISGYDDVGDFVPDYDTFYRY